MSEVYDWYSLGMIMSLWDLNIGLGVIEDVKKGSNLDLVIQELET